MYMQLKTGTLHPLVALGRDCLGTTFAMMEAKTLMTMLYQHFT
jgi:hypothetical protein